MTDLLLLVFGSICCILTGIIVHSRNKYEADTAVLRNRIYELRCDLAVKCGRLKDIEADNYELRGIMYHLWRCNRDADEDYITWRKRMTAAHTAIRKL
jgi:hypothetical protein